MTEVLDREQVQFKLPKMPKIAILFVLAAFILVGDVSLPWTKNLAHAQVAESSQHEEVHDQQLKCLAKNIYHEAGSEPMESKIGVAQVTLNRVNSGKFPSDICGVIYQKSVRYEKVICQFSWVCSRSTAFKTLNKELYRESMEIAKKVLLEGVHLPSLKNALFFHSSSINPGWKRKRVKQYGGHVFYE